MSAQYQQIIALAKQRARPIEIAKILRLPVNAVYEAIKAARIAGEDIPSFTATRHHEAALIDQRPASLVVPTRLNYLLAAKAAERGVSPSELARQLLERGLLGATAPHE